MDDSAQDTADPEADPGEPVVEPRPSRRRPTPLVLAVSLAVVFAVAAAGMAVLLAGRGGDDGDDALRAAAGRFGEALVTYDYHDPQAHREAVLDFATGSFREEYQAAFDQGLGKIITEVQAVSTGYVKDVYLSAVDEERAQAIVVVDIEHEGTSGPSTLYDVYFRLTLVRVGGEWKVDQVTDLNFDTGPGATAGDGSSPDPTASTTTSIP
jgi:Mce-associated membrane protein